MKNKRARVYYNDICAGVLEKRENGFIFTYDSAYLKKPNAAPISINLPLRTQSYESNVLFPFFEGIIPEGWLFELNAMAFKIDTKSDFEMLMRTGRDCIGAVSVIPEEE